MPKLKGQEILRKQKEAKQKKLLMVLAPIFLLLMVWQGPGYVKMLTGGDETAAVTTETPTGAVPTTPDPSTAPPPSTVAPGGTPAPTPAPVPGEAPAGLVDSDRPATPEAGQLVAFDRFVGKDPFRQIVDTSPPVAEAPPTTNPPTTTLPPTTPGGGSGGTGNDPGGDDDGDGGDDGDDGGTVPYAAVLSVNGDKETVALDEPFPNSEKIFVLTRLSRSSAWIGLVAGEFSNGRAAIEVRVGRRLNLVSQPDGIRYTIKVVSIRFR
ncbi:MAG TPA: hypothetical protein VHK22_05400 [Gaiellaceae bacterium]|jgi:hypothetical protein|nr:hypothetical protein [Gaiellaceae bacterium]